MPFVILPTNSISGGYDITNSLRFNSGSSDRLTRTLSTGISNTIGTISLWVKRANLSATKCIFGVNQNGDNFFNIQFGNSSDQLNIRLYDDGSPDANYNTTAVFRDVSAWYHVVIAFDTTQATSADRIKVYVNNTLHSLSGYPPQNQTMYTGTSGVTMGVGESSFNNSHYDGYLSEYYFIDGQQLTPSSFGETDEDTGIWKPKAYTGTYGTNGFYLQFKNSASLGTDSSGNGNTFTVNNLTSADQTTDTPTNNFATLNPLGFAGTIPTFSQGNLNVVCGSGVSLFSVSTIGVSSGKWYCEGEIEEATPDGGLYYIDFGFADRTGSAGTSLYVTSVGRLFWHSSWDGKINYRNNGSTTTGLVTGLATFVTGDFFQLYLDMDNKLMYWGKNGSLLNSTGVSFSGKESLTGEYFFAFGDQYASGTHEYALNFGQGSIDGVGVSAYQDVNGFGNFKYNPTVTTDEGTKNFLALCTKNLATFG
jgi:hypothetical protein